MITRIFNCCPVYIVTLMHIQVSTSMALPPAISIGDQEIQEWGSNDTLIFLKIYCDSLLESFTAKYVNIFPPGYPSSKNPIQKGFFPDSATVDSLKSAAKNGTATLPNLQDVLS